MTFYRYTYTISENGVVSFYCQEYILHRETPCGYWVILDYYQNFPDAVKKEFRKKWISKTSRKKSFAWSTKERAWEALKKRSERYEDILQWRLNNIRKVLSAIDYKEMKEAKL